MRISFRVYKLCIKCFSPVARFFRAGFSLSCASIRLVVESIFPKKLPRPRARTRMPQKTENSIRIGNVAFQDEDVLKNVSKMNEERLRRPNEPNTMTTMGMKAGGKPLILFRYREACIKPFLWQIKYYDDRRFLKLASDMWSDELIAFHAEQAFAKRQERALDEKFMLIHPPSSGHALGTKSFDQMDSVIQTMMSQTSLGNFYARFSDALEYRRKDIAPQHSGNRRERMSWTEGKFRLSEDFIKTLREREGKGQRVHIICIDDIMTTGATFRAIERLIRQHGKSMKTSPNIEVSFSAFAH